MKTVVSATNLISVGFQKEMKKTGFCFTDVVFYRSGQKLFFLAK